MLAQLDRDSWNDLVKDAFKNWYETDALNRHPLTEMKIVERQTQTDLYSGDPYRKAKALREVIKSAVTLMGVDGQAGPDLNKPEDVRWMDRHWRHHNILMLSYMNYSPGEVADQIGLALGGQYYRDQARAFEMLAEVLRTQEGNPIDAASTAALAYPSGAVKLNDPFYIERDVDVSLIEALNRPGDTITIRGPRQVGKTSLLMRGIYQAQRQFGARVIYFDMQGAGEGAATSLDEFLRILAEWFFDELGLDLDVVAQAWESRLPAQRKLTKLMEQHVLTGADRPVLLAMDEIDRIQLTSFHADFFGLIRSWHNRRAGNPIWNSLTTIMAISTEPYLLIDDLNQSPFNVGHVLYLRDFDEAQVVDLNQRYGSPVSPEQMPRLMGLLNGHPYLSRVALYTMVVGKNGWEAIEIMAASDQGPFHQHLQHQLRLITNDSRLENAMKEIVHGKRCTDEAAGFRLMKAGLVVKTEDNYVSRCELYRRYFAGRL